MTPGSLPGAWAPGPCSPRSGAFPGGSTRWCWRVALGKAHSSCTAFPGDILLPRTPPHPRRLLPSRDLCVRCHLGQASPPEASIQWVWGGT